MQKTAIKIELLWDINGWEDSIILEGDTEREVKARINYEMEKRGLDKDENNCWTRLVRD